MNIGPLQLDRPLLLAPLDDISDFPFRMICKSLGADMVYTEFTSCEALIRKIPKSLDRIKICDEERPIGIQIFGGNPDSVARAIDHVHTLNPEVIDINCGCWSKNHAARGEGAGLLRDLPRMERILRAAVNASTVPVTVKTRLGWDQDHIVILDVAKIVENSGCQALTVHCRTRAQAYKGKADWSWLAKIRKVIRIPLIGNGDVVSGSDAATLFDLGCDGVMIGRAAVAHPWVFREIKHHLSTGTVLPPPDISERFNLCLRNLDLGVQHKGDYWGRVEFRKYYFGYIRNFPGAARIRHELMHTETLADVRDKLHSLREQAEAGHIHP